MQALNEEEIRTFHPLFRRTLADLSILRQRGGDEHTAHYLNDLAVRANNLMAFRKRENLFSIKTILVDFPRAFRKHIQLFLWATIILYSFVAAGMIASALYPEKARVLIPSSLYDEVEQNIESGDLGLASSIESNKPIFSSIIFTNNLRIALIAFIFGLVSILTFWVLAYNGLVLGAITALYIDHGYSLYFFSGVLPHGVFELTGICIAASAGFLLGNALLFPGRSSRWDSLRDVVPDALPLIFGATFLIVSAALIEAFITPLRLSGSYSLTSLNWTYLFKLSLSALLALFLLIYLGRGGGKTSSPREKRSTHRLE